MFVTKSDARVKHDAEHKHDHGHDHKHDQDEDSDGEAVVPPAERILTPPDVSNISRNDEIVYIVGTREGKVTKIDGLDGMPNLQVLLLSRLPCITRYDLIQYRSLL